MNDVRTRVRWRLAPTLAGTGAVSLLLGGVAIAAAPASSATSTTDPVGNGGHVKVEAVADVRGGAGWGGTDWSGTGDGWYAGLHQPCVIKVRFFNYGRGDVQAKVGFELGGSASAGRGLYVADGNVAKLIGHDVAGGLKDKDGDELYRLVRTGGQHLEAGARVKVTVDVSASASGSKHKKVVVWVKCGKSGSTPQPSHSPSKSPSVSPSVTPSASPSPSPSEPSAHPPSMPSKTPVTVRPSAPAGSAPVSETPGIPTAVDAGQNGESRLSLLSGSDDRGDGPGAAGIGLLAVGGLLLGLGGLLAARRRGKHSV